MSLILKPSEPLNFKIDLKKESKKYESNSSKFLTLAKLQSSNKAVSFEVSGEICTAGISCTDFGGDKKKKPVYSIGIKIEEEETFEPVHKLLQETCDSLEEGWEVSEPLRDDKFYFKIKQDGSGKKFVVRTNIPITPKKFSEAADATNLHVEGEVSAWFNFADKKAGLLFTPKYLTFDEDDDEPETVLPPPKKRRVSPPVEV
jgi:hypothetical protein